MSISFSRNSFPTVKGTQIKGQNLKHGKIADIDSQSSTSEHKSSLYPGSFAVSAAIQRDGRLPLGFRDGDFESSKFSLVALIRFALILGDHGANLFFLVEEIKFLTKPVQICDAYQ